MMNAETGRPPVHTWLGWEPTPYLRQLRTANQIQLQQLYRRLGQDSCGAVCDQEEEWREIPTEVVNNGNWDK